MLILSIASRKLKEKAKLQEIWIDLLMAYYFVETSIGLSVENSDRLVKHDNTPGSFQSLPTAENLFSIVSSSFWKISTSWVLD